MNDLTALLSTAVGSGYRIERELGGGMSRVFVAEEVALGRRAVACEGGVGSATPDPPPDTPQSPPSPPQPPAWHCRAPSPPRR